MDSETTKDILSILIEFFLAFLPSPPPSHQFTSKSHIMSCDYANAFGEPGTGVHAPRLFGVAIIDVLLTLLAAAGSSYYCQRRLAPIKKLAIKLDDINEEEVEEEIAESVLPSSAVPPIVVRASATGFVSRSALSSQDVYIAKGKDVLKHFIVWFVLAECLHAAFGTKTAVINSLGGSRCK